MHSGRTAPERSVTPQCCPQQVNTEQQMKTKILMPEVRTMTAWEEMAMEETTGVHHAQEVK